MKYRGFMSDIETDDNLQWTSGTPDDPRWTKDLPTEPGWYAVATQSAAGMFATFAEADVDTGELWAQDWEHDWFRVKNVATDGWLWCKIEIPPLPFDEAQP